MLKHKLLQAHESSPMTNGHQRHHSARDVYWGGERRGGKQGRARQARRRLWQQWP